MKKIVPIGIISILLISGFNAFAAETNTANSIKTSIEKTECITNIIAHSEITIDNSDSKHV